MHENEDVLELHNTQVEMIIIGTLWKNPETFAYDYMDIIQNRDFSDSACRFYHVLLNKYIVEYSTEVTEQKLNMYVTQNSDVLSGYKKYGFYKTIAEFMKYAVNSTDEMKKQVDILKKWSVLRALSKDGYDVSKVLSHPKFDSLTSEQVANLIRGRTDKICNGILSNIDDPILLTDNAISIAESFLEEPQHGIRLPFEFLNELFLGAVKSDVMGLSMVSNSGKSRLVVNMLMHISCLEDVNVGLISNEMTEESSRVCAYVTLLNSPKIQELHGERLCIPQKRFVSGWYKDSNGEIIRRNVDSNGVYNETLEDFKARVYRESAEYRSVLNALKWYSEKQKTNKGLVYFKNVCSEYSNESVSRVIRQLCLGKENCEIFAYDTCKAASNSDIGSWSEFTKTVTLLTELNKSLNKYGILTFQLNNGALERPIHEIDASNLATASYTFQLLDELLALKILTKEECDDYCIRTPQSTISIDSSVRHMAVSVLKNRRGPKNMRLLDINLDLNTWTETEVGGILIPKPKKKRNEIWGES